MSAPGFLKTKKGQLIAACSLLVLSQVFLFSFFGKKFFSNMPNEKNIAAAKAENKKLKDQYQTVAKEIREEEAIKKKYNDFAAQAWVASHDGDVQTLLRQRVSHIAAKQQFRLNNIGAVRTGRINEEFFYAEIDISGNGDIGDVMKLLAELSEGEPAVAWRRLQMHPDNRYRPVTGVGAANLASRLNELPPTRLNFYGALRVIVYDGPLTARQLQLTRPHWREAVKRQAQERRPLRNVPTTQKQNPKEEKAQ